MVRKAWKTQLRTQLRSCTEWSLCSVTAGRNTAEKKDKLRGQEHGKDKKQTQMQKVGRAAGRKEKNRLKREAQTEGGNGKEGPEGDRENNTS